MVGIALDAALSNSIILLEQGAHCAEDHWALAQDWLEQNKGNEALDVALNATKLYPDRPEGWFLLGIAQAACDHDKAAENAFRKTFTLQLQQGQKPVDEKHILAQVQALQQRMRIANKQKYG